MNEGSLTFGLWIVLCIIWDCSCAQTESFAVNLGMRDARIVTGLGITMSALANLRNTMT